MSRDVSEMIVSNHTVLIGATGSADPILWKVRVRAMDCNDAILKAQEIICNHWDRNYAIEEANLFKSSMQVVKTYKGLMQIIEYGASTC